MKEKDIKNKKIGVLMGGRSAEREVSLKSGRAVLNALKALKYNATPVDAVDDLCFVLKRKKIDIAFIALHGGCGENGAVQGLLEVMGIPYTGSGVLASALAMDKEASKKFFIYHGISVPPFQIVRKKETWTDNHEKDIEKLRTKYSLKIKIPCVVKPATEGSSVGVEIVKKKTELSLALKKAFEYSDVAVIEEYIKGREVQIAILDNKVLGGVEVRPSLEFYSYEAKYTAGMTDYILPPEINKKVYEKAKQMALDAHMALGCKGATRVDLIIDEHNRPYVLEVNTIPGMTETSLLPKIARSAGLEFPELIERILKEAVREG